jgi:hypothetical protein
MGIPVNVACICLLLLQYESVHYEMYFFVCILYIKFHKSFVCIYFNSIQFEKCMWHILVGCCVCYSMFCRDNERFLSCSMPRCGWSGMLQSKSRDGIVGCRGHWCNQDMI